jgi:Response regulator containing a CheY-like receiver domain and an HTH DNA-binding domain
MDKYEIEQTLRDYHWMVREIARLRDMLSDAGERVVRNYEGLDMPKPQGRRSDPVSLEASRRERLWRKLQNYEQKVKFVQERMDVIEDEREKTVLDCLLDGMSLRSIAEHLGLSRRHVQNIKERIVEQFCSRKQCG